MNDLISRQAAIDAVDKRFDGIPMEQTQEILLLRRDLRTLPSAQPEPQWIPISVKLPEKRQDVIVTVNDGMIYTDTDEWIGTGFFAYGHNVVAWQSLPDPWKGEEE